MMHGLASVDRTPWAASLAPAGARAVLDLVTRHPDLLGAGVATLSKFGAADAEAARAIAALKASFPDRVGQIDGAIDEAGR